MENPETRKEEPEVRKATMRIVCSYCGKELGTKDNEGGSDGAITHGMCPECYDKEIKKIEDALKKPK